MKKILFSIASLLVVATCFGQEQSTATAYASKGPSAAGFSWATTSHDFGKTKVGIPVGYEFGFTNTGMVPLIISSVKASCGCTVTAYTREPVEKGGSGFVRVTYDGAKTGAYSKTVTVYANTPEGMLQLTIRGEIVQ